ncbi:hypothetical protein P885DRAFT_43547 [Corynascus similis CBS 632.67]
MASQSTGPSQIIRFPTRIRRQRKACAQCTRSKRKCGREVPSCVRCSEKGILCTYASQYRTHHGTTETAFQQTKGEDNNGTTLRRQSPSVLDASAPTATSRYPFASDRADSSCDLRWFLSVNSWTLQHGGFEGDGPSSVCEQTLPHFINTLKKWGLDWVRDGHSPLMHKHLYAEGLPECIEDCLTALAAYNSAESDSAKARALRIVDDRANRLVESQPQDIDDDDNCCEFGGGSGGGITSSILLSTPAHLTRTQALFVYQLVRLFDGDIGARARAERHMDTLLKWAKQMVESAQLDCAAADLILSLPPDQHPLPPSPSLIQASPPPPPDSDSNINRNIDTNMNDKTKNNNPFLLPHPPRSTAPDLWRAWVHGESIRRIYTAAVHAQVVYDTLRRGWSTCPGMVAFSAQQGLWDAPSAHAWLRALQDCEQGAVAMAGSTAGGVGRILREAEPEEVDQFAVAVLEISFGLESVDKWMFEKGRVRRAGGVMGITTTA